MKRHRRFEFLAGEYLKKEGFEIKVTQGIKAERDSAIDWTDGIRLEPFAPDEAGTILHGTCRGHRYRLCCRPVAGHFITVAMPVKA